MPETIFSKIIRKEIPVDIVYEDDECMAFRDIKPQAPVHILLIPKKAIENIDTALPEDAMLLGKLMLYAAAIARKSGISESGYRLVVNCNKHGGQSVDHFHIHLIGGRQMQWPPG